MTSAPGIIDITSNDGFCAEGIVFDRTGEYRGWVRKVDGRVEFGRGDCPDEPDVTGTIFTDVLNMHTHCADYGLRIPQGMSLEELVAPPNGLKHKYLSEQTTDVLAQNIRHFSDDSRRFGSSTFVDFRENGAEGCRLLRENSPDAIILGRPTSPEFDPEEIDDILSVADGIGIPSISDMDIDYIEQVADVVRDRRMIFAIHASERIREDIDAILSLDPAFVVHMCEADGSDILKCAEAEVPIVVCPTSNHYFGKNPPLRMSIESGADLGIGTDNGMLCPPDVLAEMYELADMANKQGIDGCNILRAPARLFGKILNAVETHRVSLKPSPVTIFTSTGERLCITHERGINDGIQQDSCAYRRKRIHQSCRQEGGGTGKDERRRDHRPVRP